MRLHVVPAGYAEVASFRRLGSARRVPMLKGELHCEVNMPRWIGWCSRCRAQSEEEPAFLPPFDCEICAAPNDLLAPADLQARLLAEQLASASASPRVRPDAAPKSRLLSFRAAALALGVRRGYLAEQASAGNIRTVGVGRRVRVAAAELDRLLDDGLPALPGEKEPAAHLRRTSPERHRRPSSRRSRRSSAKTPGQIAAEILKVRL